MIHLKVNKTKRLQKTFAEYPLGTIFSLNRSPNDISKFLKIQTYTFGPAIDVGLANALDLETGDIINVGADDVITCEYNYTMEFSRTGGKFEGGLYAGNCITVLNEDGEDRLRWLTTKYPDTIINLGNFHADHVKDFARFKIVWGELYLTHINFIINVIE